MKSPVRQPRDSSTLLDSGILFQQQPFIDSPENPRLSSANFADDRERGYRLSGVYDGLYDQTSLSVNTDVLVYESRGGNK